MVRDLARVHRRNLADVVAGVRGRRVQDLQRVPVDEPHPRIRRDLDRAGGQDRYSALPRQHVRTCEGKQINLLKIKLKKSKIINSRGNF